MGRNEHVRLEALVDFKRADCVHYRAMIIFFTSTAFTDWVQNTFDVSSDAAFNPYLTFLFYAL